MVFEDYHLHEQIRVILIRHWVDLTGIEYGVTNGVVYITGTLRNHTLCQGKGNGHAGVSGAIRAPGNGNWNGSAPSLAAVLEERFRGVHGVRDVVFHLDPPSSGSGTRSTP